MAHLINNTFSSYKLSDEELLRGQIYSIDQMQVLQNELAKAADEKLLLEFDPTHPELFSRDEAFLRGQIELLQYMLAASEGAVDALQVLLSSTADPQR